MVKDSRRYTFPFVSRSAAYVDDLGDQFWIFDEKKSEKARNSREQQNSFVADEPSQPEVRRRRKKVCRPCQKFRNFKTERMDPVIKTVQSYIGTKATSASENFRVMRDVVKSEEFKEIKTNFSEGRYAYEPNEKYHKAPVIQRFRHAASDAVFLFKVRKSQWF